MSTGGQIGGQTVITDLEQQVINLEHKIARRKEMNMKANEEFEEIKRKTKELEEERQKNSILNTPQIQLTPNLNQGSLSMNNNNMYDQQNNNEYYKRELELAKREMDMQYQHKS